MLLMVLYWAINFSACVFEYFAIGNVTEHGVNIFPPDEANFY